MFTHQPTWDDCQQLLRILFTTEERERIQLEARKLVPGEDGRPTVNPDLINAAFPLTRPDWDYTAAEGRGRLLIYRQTLMAGLRAAARKPTNLAKVYSVVQELLPYALYRVRNSPYKLGLTPYEITFGKPTPIIPNLDQDNSLLSSLRALQRVHEAAWPKLRELYETGPPPTPHQYRPGDWVLVKRHQNLEPRWKGPYQIILTTPTAIKQRIGPDNSTTYFTAILQSNRAAIASDNNMQLQAGCSGSVGAATCWNPRAPIHVSDSGGPQDAARQIETQTRLKDLAERMYPRLNSTP
ncbi:Hypothetical predicted protein [Lynx pardinus]|uniref:Murine leukemia virus integrase C-terminal domain-containing protein n=1 Tax=Lynx pardinus TaxID=191816 RepID=A0A485NT41_LYNPA|nr:Hypothetical predicted protein [Lynx pardinus]